MPMPAGSPRTGNRKAVATNGDDRRACEVCGARLSTYNANATCWTHTLELPWKGPSTRPR